MRLHHTDGACQQAQVVLALLRSMTIEESWNDQRRRYNVEFDVNRWHNGREQGYTLTMVHKDCPTPYHCTFYEHRNTDSISILTFKCHSINPPTIDTLPAGTFKNKWDFDRSFGQGEWMQAAKWIENHFKQIFTTSPEFQDSSLKL